MSLEETITKTKARYYETDQMGIISSLTYFNWFEMGRSDWIRNSGMTYKSMEENGIFLPLIDQYCKYRKSLKYDDELYIKTKVLELTKKKIKFGYEVYFQKDDSMAAEGYSTHVFMNKEKKPFSLSEELFRLLSKKD